MTDPIDREVWFQSYLAAARAFAGNRRPGNVRKWARSMSLIAEQFAPNDDPEPAEQEAPQ